MKFVLLINLKSPTTANSFLLNIAEHDQFSANKNEKCQLLLAFSYLLAENILRSDQLSMKKSLIISGPVCLTSLKGIGYTR